MPQAAVLLNDDDVCSQLLLPQRLLGQANAPPSSDCRPYRHRRIRIEPRPRRVGATARRCHCLSSPGSTSEVRPMMNNLAGEGQPVPSRKLDRDWRLCRFSILRLINLLEYLAAFVETECVSFSVPCERHFEYRTAIGGATSLSRAIQVTVRTHRQ